MITYVSIDRLGRMTKQRLKANAPADKVREAMVSMAASERPAQFMMRPWVDDLLREAQAAKARLGTGSDIDPLGR